MLGATRHTNYCPASRCRIIRYLVSLVQRGGYVDCCIAYRQHVVPKVISMVEHSIVASLIDPSFSTR